MPGEEDVDSKAALIGIQLVVTEVEDEVLPPSALIPAHGGPVFGFPTESNRR